MVLAHPSRRLGANLLDGLLVLVTVLVGWLVWSLLVSSRGLTPGKQLLGLRVVALEERVPARGVRMLVREFLAAPLIGTVTVGIGSLWLLWDQDRQQLYDKIARTIVVDDRQRSLDSGERRITSRPLRVSLVVLAVAVPYVGLAALAVVFFPQPQIYTVGTDGDLARFGLEVGDCGDGPLGEGGSWTAGNAVPCDTPHEFEVYAATELSTDEPIAGIEDLVWAADIYCMEQFEAFVGIDYWESELEIVILVPSEPAWREGHRSAHCLAADLFGDPLVGTVGGSQR